MDWSFVYGFTIKIERIIMKKEYNKSRRVFEKIVNPLLVKHMLDPFKYKGSCIAAGIPIKYLKYFKMVSRQKNAKKIRYRYRGKSGMKTQYKTGLQMHYIRPQSLCHMDGADTFAIYYRNSANNYFRYS